MKQWFEHQNTRACVPHTPYNLSFKVCAATGRVCGVATHAVEIQATACYYGIFTWLPKLLVEQGNTVVKTFEYVLVMIVAQLPGYIAAAALVEKIGRKATLAGFLAACAVCAWFFGQSSSVAEVMAWGSLMSFFNLGAWGVLYTYTPELYPLRFRAFASGWAGAIGRIGGILAPMVVAQMVGGSGGFGNIFMMFAGVMMLIVLVILALGEETKGRMLEEISS